MMPANGVWSSGDVLVVAPLEAVWLAGNELQFQDGKGCLSFEVKGKRGGRCAARAKRSVARTLALIDAGRPFTSRRQRRDGIAEAAVGLPPLAAPRRQRRWGGCQWPAPSGWSRFSGGAELYHHFGQPSKQLPEV
jgi:hypothetical protein